MAQEEEGRGYLRAGAADGLREGQGESGADTNAEVGAREAWGGRSPARGGRRRGRLGPEPAQSAAELFLKHFPKQKE